MAAKRQRHVWNRRKKLILRVVSIAIAVFCVLVTANDTLHIPFIPTWQSLYADLGLNHATVPEGQLTVTVLDVGNADSILLQCNGKSALIDAGENGDDDAVVDALKRAGVETLEYVIATHADADHIGGMDTVIRSFPIQNFLMSFMPEGHTPTTRTYERMLEAMVECDVTPIEAEHNAQYAFGDATITILSGLSDYEDTNDQSVVCLVSHGEMDFLFMGDAGKEVEREILSAHPTLQAEVLKVGHHGSRTSSDGSFVRSISPQIAVITCGFQNAYEHPHTETLQVLERNDVTVYRCDLNGTITLTSDGKTVTAQPERE
ncbi:MAG: MBL fold metallo-hydrolase [Clostridia bacterium]|nr:MBL fold metallo-hydrolase [Clostridia bacterium]